MHVGIANPRWRGKRSRHSRCMRNPQFYVSVKRSIVTPYCKGPIFGHGGGCKYTGTQMCYTTHIHGTMNDSHCFPVPHWPTCFQTFPRKAYCISTQLCTGLLCYYDLLCCISFGVLTWSVYSCYSVPIGWRGAILFRYISKPKSIRKINLKWIRGMITNIQQCNYNEWLSIQTWNAM